MTEQAIIPQDTGADEEFRSLSIAAAAALGLGVFSVTVLATPLLLVVPVAAVLMGCLALAQIRRSAGALAGSNLARWGIALGLACLVAAFVRSPVRNSLLRSQAQAVGSRWLSLMAESRFDDALPLMTLDAVRSLAPRHSPEADTPAPDDLHAIVLDSLRRNRTVLRLAELQPPLAFASTPAAGSWPAFDAGRTLLLEDFTISSPDGGDSCRVQVRLTRSKQLEAEGQPWRVDSWQLQDASAAASPAATSL